MATPRPPFRRFRLPALPGLAVGLVLGYLAASPRAPAVLAVGGDRSGESIVSAGIIGSQYSEGLKVQVTQDALYFLDYKRGRLLGAVPSIMQSAGKTRFLDDFVERDLVADFKIEPGAAPRFLMTTAALGVITANYAPLFVFETTTGQVAVYRITPQSVGTKSTTKLELLELKRFVTEPEPGR